jgi:demethylmenaquinone methyltransferase/2-methoxy-6-polyprenyl-1,4-benzoquinol methylase
MYGPGDVRFFDRLARLYDLAMPRARRGPLTAGLALADRPVERLVDLGGGTGRATRAVDVPERVVVDAAPGMLRRAHGKGLATVAGDARRLPLSDDVADAVLVVDALHHMPDVADVLAECERVLAPGGVLVVREFDPGTVLGRALVLGEALVGFDSRFFGPEELAERVDTAGLEARVLDRGFGYTVVGRKRESKEGADPR